MSYRLRRAVVFNLTVLFSFIVFMLFSSGSLYSHFQVILPSDDIIEQGENNNVSLEIIFMHPFEGSLMNMEKPEKFGVFFRGKAYDLTDKIQPVKRNQKTMYTGNYRIRRPGDHLFFIEPAPYFEPDEQKFIIHYAKVCVNAYGLEMGWDSEIGLKTEIIPLTRPYGLWTGNVFQGIVKAFGKPVPYAEIEVEYYGNGKIKPPASPFITQVIKADRNGVFTYACPRAGWWGFAALNEDRVKLRYKDGKSYPVEIGAVFWIKVYDMPK